MKLETQKIKHNSRGQAALFAIVIVMVLMLSAVSGATALALKETNAASQNLKSRFAYFTAEAGIDDAVYRLYRGKKLGTSFGLNLNGATSNIDIGQPSQSEREITAVGDISGIERALKTNMSINSVGASFFYGVQVGQGGLSMSNNATINGSVFSDGSITGANGASITGDVVVAGGLSSDPTIEWTTNNSDQNFATVSTNRDIAQSFTATASGALNQVSVNVAKIGAPASSLTVRIAADNGGKPSTSSLASANISPSSVGTTASWINISFSTAPNLTNGAEYWIILDYGSNSATNYWNWRKDSSDAYASNTGRTTSDWSSGSAIWTNVGGDLAFQIWIGGTITKIDTMTIGSVTTSSAHANLFVNTTVHGSNCPNEYCVVDNQSQVPLPFSDGAIQDLKDGGAAGGVCAPPDCDASGNLQITGTKTYGPKKITGTLTVTNNGNLTLSGTLWVVGDVNLSNNCKVHLASGYGGMSGVIVSNGKITVSNNCIFSGSGTAGSYIMLLADKNTPSLTTLEVSNNSLGVVYYASHGKIELENNAAAKEATGYGIEMDNNATVTYESGLANINFSSGPSGGWSINSWDEIVP